MPTATTTDRPLDWGAAMTLSPLEALMWRAESDPALRSSLVAVELLDRAPDWERLRAAHDWVTRYVPRFRMRVSEPALGLAQPVWELDPHFDLDAHLHRLRLPEGAGEEAVFAEASRIGMLAFDRARPPWEAVLVEGLPDGRAAFLLKLHHSATDGIGATQLLGQVHSRTREPWRDKPQPPAPAAAPSTTWRALLQQAERDAVALAGAARGLAGRLSRPRRALRDGLRFGASLQRVLADSGASPSPLLTGRSLTWRFAAFDVPFADLRAAGKTVGGSLNDAYLAALLGGFRRYHDELGVALDRLPMAIPISIRREGDAAGGNRFAAARLAGPAGIADPAERIRAVGRMVRAARAEPALDALGAIAPALARLPAPAVGVLAGGLTKANDLQASNVPGIRETVYLAGARVERLYPYAPLPGCATMITLVTHGDTCCIGANMDPAAVTEPDRFARCLQEGLAEVLALAPDAAAPIRRA